VKHSLYVGLLVAAALAFRFGPFNGVGLDLRLHDTYLVIPLSRIGFWSLIGIATVWFLVALLPFIRGTKP
jgi:hypothetical protein